MLKKMIMLTTFAVILLPFSFVLAQETKEIPLSALHGNYDLGWVEPNMEPRSREIHVVFPESFNPDNMWVEMSSEYLWGLWDCIEGNWDPGPATVNLRIDHPSEEYGFWSESFQPAELNGALPTAGDLHFYGSIPHSWADLAGQEVLVSLSMSAYTWPECSLVEDFFCTVNSLSLVYENIVATDEAPWGTIKAMYR